MFGFSVANWLKLPPVRMMITAIKHSDSNDNSEKDIKADEDANKITNNKKKRKRKDEKSWAAAGAGPARWRQVLVVAALP